MRESEDLLGDSPLHELWKQGDFVAGNRPWQHALPWLPFFAAYLGKRWILLKFILGGSHNMRENLKR